jgi:predicted RNA binding protein YcfA (HicA-like mRNA interferase family)
MSALPQVRGDRLIRALGKIGFVELRRTGSHAVLVHADGRTAIVAVHGSRPLPPGTLHAVLTVEQLKELL